MGEDNEDNLNHSPCEIDNGWKNFRKGSWDFNLFRLLYETELYVEYNVFAICILNFQLEFYFKKGNNE